MKKTVVIHQPDFLPYLGFFHRLLYADLYIVLDDVQFVKGTSKAWTNRDMIKTQNGQKWITVSVKNSSLHTNIKDIDINYANNWQNQHLSLIRQNYKKSAYFDELYPYLENLYATTYEKLVDFNLSSIKMLLKLFDINIGIEYSSNLNTTKMKSERLVELLTQVDTTHYLSGIGAKDYHEDEPYNEANIKVIWQNFEHPIYTQLYGKFIPYLSSIDLLFNCGIQESRKVLRSI